MKGNFIKNVYSSYSKKCESIKSTPINYKEFLKVHFIAQRNIRSLKESSIDVKKPFIAMRIDDNFIYYSEINKDKLVINIWSYDQYEILLGRKVDDRPNKSNI